MIGRAVRGGGTYTTRRYRAAERWARSGGDAKGCVGKPEAWCPRGNVGSEKVRGPNRDRPADLANVGAGTRWPFCILATGMPRAGGSYYDVNRALGSFFGSIVGWGMWSGLMFATAFYMLG